MTVSLINYMHALSTSEDLAGYTTVSATTTSASSTATQEIIASGNIDTETTSFTKFAGAWIYCTGTGSGTDSANLGLQRRIKKSGYSGSSGTFTVNRPFPAVPQSGSTWEIYWQIPAIRDGDGNDGYREIINESLRWLTFQDWIAIPAVANKTRYTLNQTTYPWIDEPDRIVQERGRVTIWQPYPNATDRRQRDGITGELFHDAEDICLQLRGGTYSAGDRFEIEVRRPANSRLQHYGTWADQTNPMAGLVSATDKAIPSINDVVLVGRELAFTKLIKNAVGDETRYWETRRSKAEAKAAPLKFFRANDNDPKPGWEWMHNMNLSAWR